MLRSARWTALVEVGEDDGARTRGDLSEMNFGSLWRDERRVTMVDCKCSSSTTGAGNPRVDFLE